MYLLDTDICIYLIRRRESLRERVRGLIPETPLYTTVVNYAELIYGAERAKNPRQERQKVDELLRTVTLLSLEREAAEIFAREKARLGAQGKPIGDFDLLIASVALQHSLILVSHNLQEFRRVQSLRTEDWSSQVF